MAKKRKVKVRRGAYGETRPKVRTRVAKDKRKEALRRAARKPVWGEL